MSQPVTSPPEFAKYTTPSRNATEFSIETSSVADVGRAAASSNPGTVATIFGSTVTSPCSSYPRLSLHDVEPAVLAALEQEVVDDERGAVPVVVPERLRHERGVVRVDLTRARWALTGPSRRRGTGCRASPRSTAGTRRGRDVAEPFARSPVDEVGQHRLARSGVEEVVVPVVRALADLDRAVLVRDDVRLAGPAGPAPFLTRDPRRPRPTSSTSSSRRSGRPTGSPDRSAPVPRRSTTATRCRGTW